jgi:hypothetical protein
MSDRTDTNEANINPDPNNNENPETGQNPENEVGPPADIIVNDEEN